MDHERGGHGDRGGERHGDRPRGDEARRDPRGDDRGGRDRGPDRRDCNGGGRGGPDRRDCGDGGRGGPYREPGGREPGGRDDRGGERRGGGPDTRFLELEMSQLLYEEASGVTREALRELIKESVKDRVRERLGDRIEALGRLAADELVDMIEANLAIEARIDDYNEGRRDARDRLRDIFAPQRRPPHGERHEQGGGPRRDPGGEPGGGERRDPEGGSGGGSGGGEPPR